jgi:hypothetical protein
VFVTSLSVLALQRVASPRTAPLIDRALGLLRREVAPGPLWRFWTHDHDRHKEIPCDADDSACATMALGATASGRRRTQRLLLANRDERGRFQTWFLPRGVGAFRPLMLRTTIAERRAGEHRSLFWEMTEATPGDVDAVVNANVLRLFGPDAPPEAVGWVSDELAAGREEEADSWHRNRFSYWYSVADGIARGVPYADAVPSLVLDRIVGALDERAEIAPLDLAHALSALRLLQGPADAVATATDRLLAAQQPDGGWARSIFFYGGPKMVFGWGSEALTTAAAIAALTPDGDAA